MKNKFLFLFTPLITFSFVACDSIVYRPGAKEIKFTDAYGESKIHTELQKEYINDSYENIALYADGTKELSKSNPVDFYWKNDKQVDYFEFKISEDKNMINSVKSTVTTGEFLSIENLKAETKYYYQVSSFIDGQEYGSKTKSFCTESGLPRTISVDGVTNVRDIGGYEVNQTQKIKQGMLIRCGRLNLSNMENNQLIKEITDDGVDMMKNQLGIKTEIDLRSTAYERSTGGVSVLGEGVNYVVAPMIWENLTTNMFVDNMDSIKIVFDALGDANNYPAIFHCNVGADRTGMIAYLIDGLLGASQNDLYRDYLFTNFGNIGGARALSGLKSYADYINDTYDGATTQAKIRNALLDCGIESTVLDTIQSLMIENIDNTYVAPADEDVSNPISINDHATDLVIDRGTNFEATGEESVEWYSSDQTIISIDANGDALPLDEGSATIIARKNDQIAKCDVDVFETDVDRFNKNITVLKNETTEYEIDLTDLDIDGDLESVTFDGELLDESEYSLSGKVITLGTDYLKNNKIYGHKNIEVKFEKYNQEEQPTKIYLISVDALVVTKVIKTASDLDQLSTLSKAEEDDKCLWGGYFLLNNDIDYNKSFTNFINWNVINNIDPNRTYFYKSGNGVGFCGTLDGNGYNIDGLKITGYTPGLLGIIEKRGVIKNISFTNAYVDDACSLINEGGSGTVENVYIDCIYQKHGWGANSNQKSGFFFTYYGGGTMKNVFIKTDTSAASTETKYVPPLGVGATQTIDNVENVYCVGTDLGLVKFTGNKTYNKYENNDVYGAYKTSQEFIDLGIDPAEWDPTFWTVKDGLPISINLRDKKWTATYTVNHKLYLDSSKTQSSAYLYKTENKSGYIGENTAAEAISVDGFTADTFSQVEIQKTGTVVDIYYVRNMLMETYEEKDTGWFQPSIARGNMSVSNHSNTVYASIAGNKCAQIVREPSADWGSVWVNYWLNAEQEAHLATVNKMTFRIRLVNYSSSDDISYSIAFEGGSTGSISTITGKPSAQAGWTTVTVTNLKYNTTNNMYRLQFYILQGSSKDGFYLCIDDFSADVS